MSCPKKTAGILPAMWLLSAPDRLVAVVFEEAARRVFVRGLLAPVVTVHGLQLILR